jgi:hypothetical protein
MGGRLDRTSGERPCSKDREPAQGQTNHLAVRVAFTLKALNSGPGVSIELVVGPSAMERAPGPMTTERHCRRSADESVRPGRKALHGARDAPSMHQRQ